MGLEHFDELDADERRNLLQEITEEFNVDFEGKSDAEVKQILSEQMKRVLEADFDDEDDEDRRLFEEERKDFLKHFDDLEADERRNLLQEITEEFNVDFEGKSDA